MCLKKVYRIFRALNINFDKVFYRKPSDFLIDKNNNTGLPHFSNEIDIILSVWN